MKDEIKIVIGSWGSYNECNERALGSSWLTLNDYNDWEEILDELKNKALNWTESTKNCLCKTLKTSRQKAKTGITSTHRNFLKH